MGVAAAVYAVVQQSSGQTQGLVAAKARLAKQRLTIPRLELVSGHMASNLICYVRDELEGLLGIPAFLANQVQKIQAHPEVAWCHVWTAENPADLGSRGGKVNPNSQL